MMQINSPNLISLLFFSENSLSKNPEERPDQLLIKALALKNDHHQPGKPSYQGVFDDDILLLMESCFAHDTLILCLCLSLQDPQRIDPWTRLNQSWEMIQLEHLSKLPAPQPWGLTRLFNASVGGPSSGEGLMDQKEELVGVLGLGSTSTAPDTTPYGWLWMLKEDWGGVAETSGYWQRDLLLLTPEDRSEKVNSYFIRPLTSGFSRIELYLQKSKHQARQYEGVSSRLNQAMVNLQNEMTGHLGGLDFSKIYREPVELERISQTLMRFLSQKAAVEILLNSLRNNAIDFQEHLDLVKLKNSLYEDEKCLILRHIEQIESDLKNAQVIQDSTYALQDIQRAAEGSRFEHASYLLGVTASLLAGISLFNSFLDIWSLSLENTHWQLPPTWLRIMLSFVASAAIPLAAIYLIGRKKKPAIVTILISLLSIAAMILTTLLINI